MNFWDLAVMHDAYLYDLNIVYRAPRLFIMMDGYRVANTFVLVSWFIPRGWRNGGNFWSLDTPQRLIMINDLFFKVRKHPDSLTKGRGDYRQTSRSKST
jgi:hypothetical protein